MNNHDAVVVGSRPNGLAAAIVIAQAGRKVVVYEAEPIAGGGARSAELTLPGFVHDACSASTPPGVGVHGMCGYFAARRALDEVLRD